MQSALQFFCFDPICLKSSYNSKWKSSLLFKAQHITAYSAKEQVQIKKRCFESWASLLRHLRGSMLPLSSELIRRISLLFSVDKQKCRDYTNEQKSQSYQVIQHTQLNSFQSSNAISLLITALRTSGCPQLAASCDTLTLCHIIIVFQLLLL